MNAEGVSIHHRSVFIQKKMQADAGKTIKVSRASHCTKGNGWRGSAKPQLVTQKLKS